MDETKNSSIESLDSAIEDSINKELEAVAKEILAAKNEIDMKDVAQTLNGTLSSYTNPSEIALTSATPNTGQGIDKVKKTPRELFILYLTNQFVNRAVNVRADTLISRGYRILGEDRKGVDACVKLIEDSGGINLFWQLSVNTDIAGDGFLEKIYNNKKNKIVKLKHVHPLTLRFKTNSTTNKIIVDKNGNPVSYEQISTDVNGRESYTDVPLSIISHLRFNTLGDEFTGISSLQSGYNTIVRLMNMEYAAAQSAIKIANPIIVGTANSKSPNQIAQWGQILGKISGRDQVFIPEGMTLSILAPGQQNFTDYASYFLDAVVSTFGVPRSMLLGESSNSNRAEGIILQRHFYSVIRSNQRYVQDFFNSIFKEYAKLGGFSAPTLEFPDVAEDADINAKSAIELMSAGIIDRNEARAMIGLDEQSDTGNKPGSLSNAPEASTGTELAKNDMKTFFPQSPGKPAGSQKGIKKTQKLDPNSAVSPFTK